MNRKSRRQWIEVLQDEPKEGINAVQVRQGQGVRPVGHCRWPCRLSRPPCSAVFCPLHCTQTVRNQVLAVSILAAATAPLISTLLNLITDAAKLDQIQEYSTIDPITAGTALVRAAVGCHQASLGVLQSVGSTAATATHSCPLASVPPTKAGAGKLDWLPCPADVAGGPAGHCAGGAASCGDGLRSIGAAVGTRR